MSLEHWSMDDLLDEFHDANEAHKKTADYLGQTRCVLRVMKVGMEFGKRGITEEELRVTYAEWKARTGVQ